MRVENGLNEHILKTRCAGANQSNGATYFIAVYHCKICYDTWMHFYYVMCAIAVYFC